MPRLQAHQRIEAEVRIPIEDIHLNGELLVPSNALGTVLFAHGSGSSRRSPRNQFVARIVRQHGVGTLLFDLLTEREEEAERLTGHYRFDIDLLARRLLGATRWYHRANPGTRMGYFGSSTGGGAALVAEAQSDIPIYAIVSRGGRPDLAGPCLAEVRAPTLLIVGGADTALIEMNQDALKQMNCPKELRLVPRATHLFEEPGALEQVAQIAAQWFELHLGAD